MKSYSIFFVVCLCFTFATTDISFAQIQPTVPAKQTIFQTIFSGPKNFFKKIFGSKAPPAVQESKKEVHIPPKLPAKNEEKIDVAVKQALKKPAEQKQVRGPTTSTSLPQKQVPTSFPILPTDSSGTAEVKLVVATGGNVFSPENKISCYSNETCNKTFPAGKKITLQAVAVSGYTFKGWSEASCGKATECTVTVGEKSSLNAYFEIARPEKRTGMIIYPKKGDVCYIPAGEDKCQMALIWASDAGLDMTIKADHKEYYVTKEDQNIFPQLSGVDPTEITKAERENADGLVYFPFQQGEHKLTILHRTEVMDSVNFKVECAPALYWDSMKCWQKGANYLYVFKQQGAIVSSDPIGIKCGYRPDVCAVGFSSEAKVSLKVALEPGYVFEGWTGDCSGKQTTCTILMEKQKSVGVKVSGGRVIEALKPATQSMPEKPVHGCVPNWECNGWSACLSMKLTRSCYDLNNCNSSAGKPQLEVACTPQSGTLKDTPKMAP